MLVRFHCLNIGRLSLHSWWVPGVLHTSMLSAKGEAPEMGMFRYIAILSVLAAAAVGLAQPSSSVESNASPTSGDLLIFTQIPVHASDKSSPGHESLPAGSRIVSFDRNGVGDSVTILTPQFLAAGRPDVSFDGQRFLFVGKRKANNRFSVWEMNVDGSNLRQVIEHSGECVSAIYLSTLYTMGADQPTYQIAFCSRNPADGIASIYTCLPDGTGVRRITFAPDGAIDPHLLSDGRLLFGGWYPGLQRDTEEGTKLRATEEGARRRPGGTKGERALDSDITGALYTVNTDGTDLFIFAGGLGGERRSVKGYGMPCETVADEVVYVESQPDASSGFARWDRGGSLVSVSRKRSLHTRKALTSLPGSGRESGGDTIARGTRGFFHSPAVLSDGKMMASYRLPHDGTYGLYVFDSTAASIGMRIFDSPEWHDVYARSVCARPIPKGRSSVVDDDVETGVIYCLNAYLSGNDRIKLGDNETISSLRILGTDGNILGDVPVEADGSFCVEVPARTPLRMQTLTADGEIVRDMRSWMWVMPKEARGCIGCHEDRELTPPNRFAEALKKLPRPLAATGHSHGNAGHHHHGHDNPVHQQDHDAGRTE